MRAIGRFHPVALGIAALLVLIPLAPLLLTALRWLDSGICAQLPSHTLAPGGVPLPLCSRNTGVYTGAALTFGILRALGRQRAMRPPPPYLIALCCAALGAMVIDGSNAVAADLGLRHLYQPANTLRLATGLGAGVALAVLCAPVIARVRYGEQEPWPAVASPRELLPFVVAAAVAYPIIWSTSPWTLYPVAFVSNAGLLLVLGGVNLSAWHVLWRRFPTTLPSPKGGSLLGVAVAVVAELAVLAILRSGLLGPAVA